MDQKICHDKKCAGTEIMVEEMNGVRVLLRNISGHLYSARFDDKRSSRSAHSVLGLGGVRPRSIILIILNSRIKLSLCTPPARSLHEMLQYKRGRLGGLSLSISIVFVASIKCRISISALGIIIILLFVSAFEHGRR